MIKNLLNCQEKKPNYQNMMGLEIINYYGNVN